MWNIAFFKDNYPIFSILHAVLKMWYWYSSYRVMRFISLLLEIGWTFVMLWPIDYSGSDTVWHPKLGHKNVVYLKKKSHVLTLLSWATHSWNLATSLWGSPSHMLRPCVGYSSWEPTLHPMKMPALIARSVSEDVFKVILAKSLSDCNCINWVRTL